VPDEPDLVPATPRRQPRDRTRRRWSIAVVTIVVAASITAVVASRSRHAVPLVALGAPHFVDESTTAGIDHRYEGGFDYFVGGGVAAFDCDGDGRSDLYVAGGTAPAALYRNVSPIGGALRFETVASPVTDLTSVTGAYPLDVDGDGRTDLVVLRNRAGNRVLRGLGGCRFEDATASLGLDGGDDWTAAFSATWQGTNRLPTLAFGSYLLPDQQTCGVSRLVRTAESGDRYATPFLLTPGYCTLSMLFSDWNRSGHADLRLANDRHYYTDGEEQLWRVAPGETPREYTTADGWQRLQIWGMGIASRDLTGDGRPEVFLTSQGDDKLQSLDDPISGRPAYHDIALRRGVTAQRPSTGGDVLPSTAWDPEFADVNDDGVVDLFISKGNVEAQADHASRDPSDLFIGRADGTFVESALAAGIVSFDKARGAALVDLNLDGMLDLVVVNREAGVKVWRNVGGGDAAHPHAMGHWISVRLHEPAPNTDAIGAWVDVRVGNRTDQREVTVGGGHAGGQLGWLHEGLGRAGSAQVRVHWPDGSVGPWMTVRADGFVTIERGAAVPVAWSPPVTSS
jgi:hypothetical protein